MTFDDLVLTYAQERGEAVEGRPWAEIPVKMQTEHLNSARVEVRYLARAIEKAKYALLPDTLPDDVAEQVGLDCPLVLGGEKFALDAGGVKLFYTGSVSALKAEILETTPRRPSSGD